MSNSILEYLDLVLSLMINHLRYLSILGCLKYWLYKIIISKEYSISKELLLLLFRFIWHLITTWFNLIYNTMSTYSFIITIFLITLGKGNTQFGFQPLYDTVSYNISNLWNGAEDKVSNATDKGGNQVTIYLEGMLG